MAKTEVILTHNIPGLGGESDQVKVAAGYARNYLFPQGLAIPVTAANKRRLEALRQKRGEREAHEFNTMSELSRSLSKMILPITVKTGEDGRMFGSVTAGHITDELKRQFDVSLDKKKIHLEQPLRSLGEHEVELRLHPEVATRLTVKIESSTPPPKAETSEAAARGASARDRGADKGGRPDRRGKPERAAVAAATPEKAVSPARGGQKQAPRGKGRG